MYVVSDCTNKKKLSDNGTNERYPLGTISNGPTNALVCNKTLIQLSHTKTLKITPRCFDHHQGAF
jgi:hypothetical protein